MASQVAQWRRSHLLMQEMQETKFLSLGREDPLEKEMSIHSSILAWEIPWTEEPDGLQSMGSQRVRYSECPHRDIHKTRLCTDGLMKCCDQ